MLRASVGVTFTHAPVSEDTYDEGIIDENYDPDAECSTGPWEEKNITTVRLKT